MKVVLIPGLGTDCRIFDKALKDFDENALIKVNYDLKLIGNAQSLSDYAKRIANTFELDRYNGDVSIIGMSLGGLVAIELSKILNHKTIVIISSIKSEKEAPFFLKLARFFRIYYFVPVWFSRIIIPVIGFIAGTLNRDGYKLYKLMLQEWESKKFIWARRAALNWENKYVPSKLVHIHGSKDELFCYKKIKPTYLIKGGRHNMILDRSEEISEILKKHLY
jgi:pimeloyl-ACP methyl ester carboxylesterase